MSRLRERLSGLLAEQGFVVKPEDFTPARGYWRTSPHADVCRWEGVGYRVGQPGVRVVVNSWDTMTACMGGIVVDPDGGTNYLVSARKGT